MRALACIVLCSCAPTVVRSPSSLPFVRVDPALSGHVMSRDAAIVIASKRIEDKNECDARVTDCEAKAKGIAKALAAETQRADSNQRAASLAIAFSVIVGVLGLSAGFGLGYGLSKAF